MSNIFVTADDILITGFDEWGKDHDETLEKVLWVCREANIKLNKDKYLFRCTSTPFFGTRCEPRSKKSSSFNRHPTTEDKRNCSHSWV